MSEKTDNRFTNLPQEGNEPRRDSFFLCNSERDSSGALDTERVIERQNNALEALETASEVHPLGPSVLVMRGKGLSYTEIGARLKIGRSTVESVHKRVAQAVITKQHP